MKKIKRKIKESRIKICGICHSEIDTKKDNWCEVIDYKGKKEMSRGYYHTRCMNDLIQGQGKVIEEKFKNKLRSFVGDILGRLRESQKPL